MRKILIAGLLIPAALLALAPFELLAKETEVPIAPPVAEFNPLTVELVDAGAEPRAPLRYKFNADMKELLVMDMTMSIAMEINGSRQPTNSVPTIRMTMALKGQELTEDGDLKYGFELTKVEILKSESANPAVVAAMKGAMSGIVGLRGWAVVDSRGLTRDADFTVPAGASPTVMRQIDQMRNQLNQMSAPFPEVAVGVGAVWRVTQTIDTSFSLTQTATYELTEYTGDGARMSVTLKQSALPQRMNLPALPPGATANLKFFESQGSGEVDFMVDRLVPESEMTMKMKMRSDTIVEAPDMPAQLTRMSMAMKMEMKIRPGAMTESDD